MNKRDGRKSKREGGRKSERKEEKEREKWAGTHKRLKESVP